MSNKIDPLDKAVLDALLEIVKMPRHDVKLIRDTNAVVEAFRKTITEDRAETVRRYWSDHQKNFLITDVSR